MAKKAYNATVTFAHGDYIDFKLSEEPRLAEGNRYPWEEFKYHPDEVERLLVIDPKSVAYISYTITEDE